MVDGTWIIASVITRWPFGNQPLAMEHLLYHFSSIIFPLSLQFRSGISQRAAMFDNTLASEVLSRGRAKARDRKPGGQPVVSSAPSLGFLPTQLPGTAQLCDLQNWCLLLFGTSFHHPKTSRERILEFGQGWDLCQLCMYVCIYVCMYLMYVCIYVCMYVSMYVCIYVCMYVSMYVCIYVCMYVWMYGCMDVWMYGCMDVWMYGCMDGWMDVCNVM